MRRGLRRYRRSKRQRNVVLDRLLPVAIISALIVGVVWLPSWDYVEVKRHFDVGERHNAIIVGWRDSYYLEKAPMLMQVRRAQVYLNLDRQVAAELKLLEPPQAERLTAAHIPREKLLKRAREISVEKRAAQRRERRSLLGESISNDDEAGGQAEVDADADPLGRLTEMAERINAAAKKEKAAGSKPGELVLGLWDATVRAWQRQGILKDADDAESGLVESRDVYRLKVFGAREIRPWAYGIRFSLDLDINGDRVVGITEHPGECAVRYVPVAKDSDGRGYPREELYRVLPETVEISGRIGGSLKIAMRCRKEVPNPPRQRGKPPVLPDFVILSVEISRPMWPQRVVKTGIRK